MAAVTSLFAGDRASWQGAYTRLLLLLDASALFLVCVTTAFLRFGMRSTPLGLPYLVVPYLLIATWMGCLALARCYEAAFVLREADELWRTVRATGGAFAAVSLLCYLSRAEVSRAFVLVVFPLGLLALLGNRVLAHRLLLSARRNGQAQRRVLVVGSEPAVERLRDVFDCESRQGYRIVAACLVSDVPSPRRPEPLDLPLVALSDLADAVRTHHVDTVAVKSSSRLGKAELRDIVYAVEGLHVEVLAAPSLTGVAGTRVSVRPVGGLPLLHLDRPELVGAHKLLKGAFDRTAAGIGLLLLSPLLLTLYVLVRLTSPGPGFFSHERIGRDGKPFQVWKLRSMYADAEERKAQVMAEAGHSGPLFKLKDDPRITPVGRFLRAWSLDELPQLLNVVNGTMSLVGPRPQVQGEVDLYDALAHRRLLVKPGITGLWQVSGRSDLEWEQAVRLDLAYVDGWSLGTDLQILARTAKAVVKSSGAY